MELNYISQKNNNENGIGLYFFLILLDDKY